MIVVKGLERLLDTDAKRGEIVVPELGPLF